MRVELIEHCRGQQSAQDDKVEKKVRGPIPARTRTWCSHHHVHTGTQDAGVLTHAGATHAGMALDLRVVFVCVRVCMYVCVCM
jgi:hypothetical protein